MCVRVCVCCVCCSQSCPILCDPMGYSLPGSSVYGIFQARIWSRLTFPTLGNLPDQGIKLMSLVSPALAGGFFTTEPPGKPVCVLSYIYMYIYTRIHTLTYGILPDGSDSKEPACSASHLRSIPGSVRSPGEGNGFLPGEFHEQRSLTGYNSPRGHNESDTTKQLTLVFTYIHI